MTRRSIRRCSSSRSAQNRLSLYRPISPASPLRNGRLAARIFSCDEGGGKASSCLDCQIRRSGCVAEKQTVLREAAAVLSATSAGKKNERPRAIAHQISWSLSSPLFIVHLGIKSHIVMKRLIQFSIVMHLRKSTNIERGQGPNNRPQGYSFTLPDRTSTLLRILVGASAGMAERPPCSSLSAIRRGILRAVPTSGCARCRPSKTHHIGRNSENERAADRNELVGFVFP